MTEHRPVAIPRGWDDVTPGWMSAALAARFPGVEVADVTLVMRDDGTNHRARFAIRYAAGQGPQAVFVKAEGEHREVHARNGNLFNESDLYAAGLPLPVDHPDAFAVLIDREALDWLIVMEDVTLRGADPRDATRPMTVEQVANGVRGLARLHRDYDGFSATSHPSLAWVQTWAPTDGFQSGLRRFVPRGLERAADHLPAEVAALSPDDVVDLWVRYVALLHRRPTLLHADAHIGNTYVLPDDEVGFLDWQVARRGHWSQDVGYFVQGSLVEADRQSSERAVVAAYLRECGHGESAEDAWCWYRASAAYGLAIWLSTLGTDGWQRHDVSLALAARYARAFTDLETVTALAALE